MYLLLLTELLKLLLLLILDCHWSYQLGTYKSLLSVEVSLGFHSESAVGLEWRLHPYFAVFVGGVAELQV